MARQALKLVLLLMVISACAPISLAKKPNPNTYTGSFAINVRGYWTGQGTATVTKNTVRIQATVIDDAGNSGTLVTAALPVVDGHFTGDGTIFGIQMVISGRVEAQDPPAGNPGKGKGKGKSKNDTDDQVLTDARLGATFSAAGHSGRVAGGRNG